MGSHLSDGGEEQRVMTFTAGSLLACPGRL
jgi:hypothetical protein